MKKTIRVTVDVDVEEYNGADVWHDGRKRWIVTYVGTQDLPIVDEILEDEDIWLYDDGR